MEIPSHFHFSHRRLVEFADTDLAGLMHFSNTFRFVEAAEHAFFRSLGFRVHSADGTAQQGWPRLDVSCRYFQPARFEQTLEICLRLEEVRASGLRYGFWIFVADTLPRSVLASGSFTNVHVALDPTTREIRKTPMPADLHQQLERTLNSSPAAS